MDYIVYTTEGYTELPVGFNVENCQIVDFIKQTQLSKEELLKEIAKEFNLRQEKINATICIHERELDAMRQIFKYLCYKEKGLCERSPIFNSLKILAKYFGEY